MTKLTPLFDKIIVKQYEESLVTEKGIILISPQEEEDAPKKGIVISVGPGKGEEMQVKPGDEILFNPYAGLAIEVDGEKYLLMQQIAVLATFSLVEEPVK